MPLGSQIRQEAFLFSFPTYATGARSVWKSHPGSALPVELRIRGQMKHCTSEQAQRKIKYAQGLAESQAHSRHPANVDHRYDHQSWTEAEPV